MSKRILSQVSLVVVTAVLVTIFQPFSYLTSFAQPGCQTFKETGHTLCGKFLTYWQQHGGLAQQGFPISEPFNEKSDLNGQTYQVQYFERAVFEAHPENAAPNDVLLSQLGTFQARSKYGNPPQFPGASAPPSLPASAPPGLDAKVALKDGVSITLASKVPSGICCPATTGIADDCNGASMRWGFTIENTSAAPFTLIVDKNSATQTDSTGKKYSLGGCGDGFFDAFRGPVTINPGEKKYGTIVFLSKDIPASAAYLDLQMTVSGTALTFRYPLR